MCSYPGPQHIIILTTNNALNIYCFFFISLQKKKNGAERELLLGKIVKDGNEQTILSNVSLGIEHFLSRKDSNPKGCLSVN